MAEDLDALFNRALELHARGCDEAAKAAYLEVLFKDTAHLGALTNLGTLLHDTGYRSAARTAYKQAVDRHPGDITARINYANALYRNDETAAAQEQYEAALTIDPDCPQAHQGLAYVYDVFGDAAAAARHRELGYRGHALVHLPYRGDGRAIMALLLVSARGGNVRTDEFLSDRVFFTAKIFAEYFSPDDSLPFHSFAFNAIGDAELCRDALERAKELLARTNAPVVNAPAAVEATTRDNNAHRLGTLPGVIAPRTLTIARKELESADAAAGLHERGFAFPLLLRSPGFHTGLHFMRAENPVDLARIVAELPGDDLIAIEPLDARGTDGLWRKYRVMIVDGALYPLHVAISDHWKVHYFTAQTGASDAYVREETAFLNDMAAVLGMRAIAALEAIRDALALDYAGVDFGLDRDGNVLLFEANATMMVPVPDAAPANAHRRPALERIYAAVEAMLVDRASRI